MIPQAPQDIDTPLSCEVINTTDQFTALESEWNHLLGCSNQNSIFLRHEWMSTWWSVFSTDEHTLSVLVIRTTENSPGIPSGQLVGIAPFQRIQSLTMVEPKLCFVGAGEPKDSQVVSEYLDLFALPQFESVVVGLVAEWIKNNQAWSSLECRDFSDDALIYRVAHTLLAAFPGRLTSELWAYRVPLNTETTLLNHLTPSRQKRLRRAMRSIDKAGGLQRHEATSQTQLDQHFNALKKLHEERWVSQGKASIFDDRRFTQFHEQVMTKLHPQGLANIMVYTIEETAVAALYLYFTESTVYYYQSGFATENANRYMPLANAHRMEIECQAAKRRTCYDFMRGESNSYKAEFGCEKLPLYYCRIHRRTGHFMAVNTKNYFRRGAGWMKRKLS